MPEFKFIRFSRFLRAFAPFWLWAGAVAVVWLLSSCGGTFINTYRAGVITSQVVTTAHEVAWSDPLRERVATCNDAVPDDAGIPALEACLAPYTLEANAKVLQALGSYRAAAKLLTAILIAAETNPDGVDQVALREAALDTWAAARELLGLFPDAKWAQRLELLTGGLQ